MSSIVTVFGVAFWVIALRSAGPPVTSFLMKFQVVFSVMLGAIFLKERLKKLEIFGILLTIFGGLVITYDTSFFELRGAFYAVMAAFCYSCLFIIVKKKGSNLNMMMVATLRSLGVSIIGILYLIFSGRFQLPNNVDLVYMIIGGTCGAYIGKALQFQAIKLVDVSRTTAVTPLEAVFVVLLTFLFFDTVPSSLKLIGGFLIIIGVIFLLVFRKEKGN
jgi:drug/metabolite transporter (DMT)-like permease